MCTQNKFLISIIVAVSGFTLSVDSSAVEPCDRFFASQYRQTAWRSLRREEKLAALVSQVTSLFMAGIPADTRALASISQPDADRVGWDRKDLMQIPERAQALFFNLPGEGYSRLLQMAGFTLTPQLPADNTNQQAQSQLIPSAGIIPTLGPDPAPYPGAESNNVNNNSEIVPNPSSAEQSPIVGLRNTFTGRIHRLPRYWSNILTFEEIKGRDFDSRKRILETYRRECRAIVEYLLSVEPSMNFTPEALAIWSGIEKLAGTTLSLEIVHSLVARAQLGFHNTGDYRKLLREYGLKIDLDSALSLTGTRLIGRGDYQPMPTLELPQTRTSFVSDKPGLSTEQQELIQIYRTLEDNDLALDLPALRNLTRAEMNQVRIAMSGEELERSIRQVFRGGWRQWVILSGGDPDGIIARSRSRLR